MALAAATCDTKTMIQLAPLGFLEAKALCANLAAVPSALFNCKSKPSLTDLLLCLKTVPPLGLALHELM